MILELCIKNLALIDETTLKFQGGLNILTGETGAGKSVLIGALGLILGERGDGSLVRAGCEEAEVSGVFQIQGPEPRRWLADKGLDPEEEILIIRRVLRNTGRGSIYVQSRPFTLPDLSRLGEILVDIHGQHDHQSLLYIDKHRSLLDQFGRLTEETGRVKALFMEMRKKSEAIKELKESLANREKEEEFLKHSLEEIEEAALKEGEEEELKARLERMGRCEEYSYLVDSLLNLLSEGRGGSLGALRSALAKLDQLGRLDDQCKELQERFGNAFYEVEDIVESLAALGEGLTFSAEEKEALEDRLDLIRTLCRKYGGSVALVKGKLEENRFKLEQLGDSSQALEGLQRERSALEGRLIAQARKVSQGRKKAAAVLEKAVGEVLKQLGMPSSLFRIQLTQKKGENDQLLCGPMGIDRVEFLFSANKGEPLKPLKEVASGGEISRVMLAIKSALAEVDQIPALVFDEIDTGIGGEVANAIGRHLRKIASFHQILCITHLASIAIYADNHIRVLKLEKEGRTKTELKSLQEGERVTEIARMLSGDSNRGVSLSHAKELLENV